MTKATNKT